MDMSIHSNQRPALATDDYWKVVSTHRTLPLFGVVPNLLSLSRSSPNYSFPHLPLHNIIDGILLVPLTLVHDTTLTFSAFSLWLAIYTHLLRVSSDTNYKSTCARGKSQITFINIGN
jgi:hypothetical protein